jgi:GDP-L-fucose synthase|tara:strand:- start:3313 stop:4251 length:939 start_codon:yes stop_codon:yes gene_type:complete
LFVGGAFLKILVLGSRGMVGSSVSRILKKNNSINLFESTRNDTNLFSLTETQKLFNDFKPDIVINAAAKVGGILANNLQRTEFILNNLKININIIESISKFPETKLINLGSSCIYPLGAEVPIAESTLMTGKLEPTNSPYAMAKLAAIEMGDAISKQFGHKVLDLMPTNLYGPNDNFSENESHVIPGLISRMHRAKFENKDKFEVWGTGTPLREFLFIDDLASAIEFIIVNNVDPGLYNIGSNQEVTIKSLVENVKDVVNFPGEIVFDETKPDGNPRKLLDSSKFTNFGWKPAVDLTEGLKITYDWFLENIA